MIFLFTVSVILATFIIVGVVRNHIRAKKKVQLYDEHWENLKKEFQSDNPTIRRTAAKKALKLIRKGPFR